MPTTECWQQAARDAARVVHKILSAENPDALRRGYPMGDRVALQFSYEDFTPELKAAAVAAFEDEWLKLVPVDARELGGGSEQVRR